MNTKLKRLEQGSLSFERDSYKAIMAHDEKHGSYDIYVSKNDEGIDIDCRREFDSALKLFLQTVSKLEKGQFRLKAISDGKDVSKQWIGEEFGKVYETEFEADLALEGVKAGHDSFMSDFSLDSSVSFKVERVGS